MHGIHAWLVLTLFKGLLTKLLSGMANKKHFYSQIINVLFTEKMIVDLLVCRCRCQPSLNVVQLPPTLERAHLKQQLNQSPASSMRSDISASELLGDMQLKKVTFGLISTIAQVSPPSIKNKHDRFLIGFVCSLRG